MNDLQIFKNKEFGEIRCLEINGEPHFVGKDAAEILGYKNPQKAIKEHVDEEDKKMGEQNGTPYIIDNLGRKQYPIFINESGLYSLILSSKLPNAKKFKRWVTSEVLPTIRKNGMYATDELLNNPDLAIEVFKQLKQEREEKNRLKLENAQQKQLIGELKPKADYTDNILNNKGLVTMTAIAKDYGMSANKLNLILHNLGIQYKQSEQWFLYSKYQNCGYTHSKTIELKRKDGTDFVRMNTKWTQKGRLFLYELLKKNGLVPVIER